MFPDNVRTRTEGVPAHLVTDSIEQVWRAAASPISAPLRAHVPDGHFGKEPTVGPVISTEAVILLPAFGLDIGCRMYAAHADPAARDLSDTFGAARHDLVDVVHTLKPGLCVKG